MLMFIMAGGFLAAFVDSVVGGGGMISLPVLMATGIPPHLVLGTNKLASSISSLTSTLSFVKSGRVDKSLVKRLCLFSAIGGAIGTTILHWVPSSFLRPMMIVMLLVVTVFTLTRKQMGDQRTYAGLTGKSAICLTTTAIVLGGYDGFFGPGTGSFLIFAFLLVGFDFVGAAGNAKVLNLCSGLASLSMFAVFRSIDYRIGLAMGLAMVFGSLVGSQLAIKKGTRFVRPLFLSMSALLIAKQLWDFLQ
ncbi:sulfite exporter TauE/SafE family protein [Gorillibacterium sp. sgz500922]|uniref:sulfite exporter TauE/SafE family protein n=1 Tax=Gorillibacterium sp. sgz500922 TaxID=3446694 RepID=UPI003F664C69